MPFYSQPEKDAIKAAASILDVARTFGIEISRQGTEHVGLSPFQEERTPSCFFNDDKGGFHCHSSGEKGDVYRLVQTLSQCSFPDAVHQVASMVGMAKGEAAPTKRIPPKPAGKKNRPPEDDYKPVIPAPADAPKLLAPDGRTIPIRKPRTGKSQTLKPSLVHPYRMVDGALIGYVVRIETRTGKQTIPITYCQGLDDWSGWAALGFPRQTKPMYGLERLAPVVERYRRRDRRPAVLITEGEKCADAAHGALGDTIACLSWVGGTNAIDQIDWSPIAGSDVIVWPDADLKTYKNGPLAGQLMPAEEQPGIKAAIAIKTAAEQHDCRVVILDPYDEDRPDGWDVADAIQVDGWSTDQVVGWIKARKSAADSKTPAAPREHDAPPDTERLAELRVENRWNHELQLTREGEFRANEVNVGTVLRLHEDWQGVLTTNRFDGKTEVLRVPEGLNPNVFVVGELTSVAIKAATMWFQDFGLYNVSDKTVNNAIDVIACEQSYHPVYDYLSGITWDGVERLTQMGSTYFAADISGETQDEIDRRTAYVEQVFYRWMIGAVARIAKPGCQMDYMLILEGAQGLGKSTALRILAKNPEWFVDEIGKVGEKSATENIRGKWIVEIAELASIRKSEVDKVKSFLTTKSDRYREPYQPRARDYPRQCVFAGTTNQAHYLKDVTGGRRFWPVKITMVDREALARDVDQLWAEAAHWLKAGEQWFLPPTIEAIAADEQQSRFETDVWTELIAGAIDNDPILNTIPSPKGLTSLEIARKIILISENAKVGKPEEMRIASIMKNLGFQRKRTSVGGRRSVVWDYPETEPVVSLGA